MKSFRYRSVLRIHLQRKIGVKHDENMSLRCVMGTGHGPLTSLVLRNPLSCANGTFCLLPFITKQVVEVIIAPLNGIRRTSTFGPT